MRLGFRSSVSVSLITMSFLAGCSGSQGGPQTGGVPAIVTAAAPSPVPTVTPTPVPTETSLPLSCSAAPAIVPGTYTTIESNGTVSGNTYSQAVTPGSGSWFVSLIGLASPPPLPPPTPTLSPGQTPTPAPTPDPTKYVLYSGVYTVPSFSGTSAAGKAFTTAATQGCALLLTRADGQSIDGTGFNAAADGGPFFDDYITNTLVSSGMISSFSITGLGVGTGAGSFTLDNGTVGTVTIQSRATYPEAQLRQTLRRYVGAARSQLH